MMDRLTFIRRLLSPFRHLSRHHASYSNVQHEFSCNRNVESENVWTKRFTVRDFHPKSIPQVNYDEIINGEIEDFSPDCWLDGHIHQFADANNINPFHSDQHEFFSSQDGSNSDQLSSRSGSDSSSPQMGNHPRNILVDLFIPISNPPPYSNDPPPSYEEAVSTFFNLGDPEHERHDSDWMW